MPLEWLLIFSSDDTVSGLDLAMLLGFFLGIVAFMDWR